jgi:hypothetical protein
MDLTLDAEEGNNKIVKLYLAANLTIFYGITIGHSAVLKMFQPIYLPIQIMQLYLYYICFEKVIFYKSVLNKYSKEFYIVALNFKGIDPKHLSELFKIYENFDKIKNHFNTNNLIFDTYPKSFIVQLLEILNNLSNVFITEMQKQLYYTDNINAEVYNYKEYMEYVKQKNKEYIKKFIL